MSVGYVALIMVCVIGISLGQVLFKLAAMNSAVSNDAVLWHMVGNHYLILGGLLYIGATLLWVWLLRSVPLNIAYPFMALAFVFVPLLGAVVIGESFEFKHVLGGLCILLGVLIIWK